MDALRRRRPRGDRGSFALELVLLAPILLVLTLAILAAGRYTTAQQAVSDAAREAARAATIDGGTGTVADQTGTGAGGATTGGGGVDAATQQAADVAARADLDQRDLHCTFPAGDPASLRTVTAGDQLGDLTLTDLRASVTCSLDLSDLGFPGLPGHVTITEHAVSAEDPLRGGTG